MNHATFSRSAGRSVALSSAVRRAGLACLAGLATALTMTTASAQAAGVVGRKPFQKFISLPCGPGVTNCNGPVYTVPTKRRLEITSLSCEFTVRSPATLVQAPVLANDVKNSDKDVLDYFVPVLLGENGGFHKFAFNSPTLLTGRAGDKFLISVSATDEISNLNCKVAGDLLVLE